MAVPGSISCPGPKNAGASTSVSRKPRAPSSARRASARPTSSRVRSSWTRKRTQHARDRRFQERRLPGSRLARRVAREATAHQVAARWQGGRSHVGLRPQRVPAPGWIREPTRMPPRPSRCDAGSLSSSSDRVRHVRETRRDHARMFLRTAGSARGELILLLSAWRSGPDSESTCRCRVPRDGCPMAPSRGAL